MSSPQPQTVEEREAEQARFYGQYVAVAPIDLEGGRAFNPGDPVGIDHVESGKVRPDQVAKTSTKAGRRALGLEDEPAPSPAPASTTPKG